MQQRSLNAWLKESYNTSACLNFLLFLFWIPGHTYKTQGVKYMMCHVYARALNVYFLVMWRKPKSALFFPGNLNDTMENLGVTCQL